MLSNFPSITARRVSLIIVSFVAIFYSYRSLKLTFHKLDIETPYVEPTVSPSVYRVELQSTSTLVPLVERIQNDTVDLTETPPRMVQVEPPRDNADRRLYFLQKDEFGDNRTCKIPYIYPYEEKAMLILRQEIITKKIHIPSCIASSTAKFKTDQITNLIRHDPTGVFWKDNFCCYTPFAGANVTYRNLTTCIEILETVTTIPTTWQDIQVHCMDVKTKRKLTYRDYFHFLRLNSTVEKELDQKLIPNSDQPSVIILGLDTVSFANFQRFLPKSRDFLLKEMKAIEFSGMNKIGLGTLNNMVPLLTNCQWSWGGETIFPENVDVCRFIWETFSEYGYRTVVSYEEYWPLLHEKMRRGDTGTLNVTYDNLPFTESIQRTCPSALHAYGCYEHKYAFDILADRLIQVAQKLSRRPYFHYLWSVVGTHEVTAMAQFVDDPLHKLLQQVHAGNLLENTILFLISDHGMVYSTYGETFEGNIEANAPLLYVLLPTTFRRKYSSAVANLERNSKGLATPLDIRETLLDILNLSSVTNQKLEEDGDRVKVSSSGGISLFRPIPLNRSCSDAKIPKLFCLCWKWTQQDSKTIGNNSEVRSAAIFTVNYINDHLKSYPQCQPLSLEVVTGAKTTVDVYGYTYFSVAFQVAPSGGKLQAMVKIKKGDADGNRKEFQLMGNVERKNEYGKQSACLGPKMQLIGWIRSVCYCNDFNSLNSV